MIYAPDPVRWAIYTRELLDAQRGANAKSPAAQLEACRAYIASRAADRWTAQTPHYSDRKQSGTGLGRPSLQRLLRDVEASKVDLIVVQKISCLTPSLRDLSAVMMVMDYGRCKIAAADQALDTATPEGRRVVSQLTILARLERGVGGERALLSASILGKASRQISGA